MTLSTSRLKVFFFKKISGEYPYRELTALNPSSEEQSP